MKGRGGATRDENRTGELTIRYGVTRCFLGCVIVASTDRGVCAIEFGDDQETLPDQVQKRFPMANVEEAGPEYRSTVIRIASLIDAPMKENDLPLDIRGTVFQERVWKALRGIPPGTTLTYTELAKRIGRPKAARAVGSACAANTLAVAIPCHRVVRQDGKMGGYRWGVERKRRLIRRERQARRGAQRK